MSQYPLGYLNAQNRGRYFEAANAGREFAGGNQAAVPTAMTAGVPTTYTGGLVIANPTTSTINVSINTASMAFATSQTNTASIGLGVAHSTSALSGTLTAITPVCTNVGKTATPQAKLYSSASVTLPTAPKIVKTVGVVAAGAVADKSIDVGGEIILPPGSYCVFTSSATGTASSFLGAFSWEEMPVGTTL